MYLVQYASDLTLVVESAETRLEHKCLVLNESLTVSLRTGHMAANADADSVLLQS